MSTFRFFVNESNLVFTFDHEKTNDSTTTTFQLPFVSFGFSYFLVVFEQSDFYFHFDHSDVRIKQNVSLRYRNDLKIRPQKRIGFMHVDITSCM
jgi:hypothetical protein